MTSADTLRQRVRDRLAEQRSLVAQLLRLREQISGSVFARWGECGKPNCVCREGRKHGPYYVLSTRSAGKGGFAYLDAHRAEQAKALVARSQKFRTGLRRLRKVNLEIVSLLRRYQAAMSKQGGRKIGIALHA
jgi:Family of unknown function (DUF6788)